MAEPDKRQLGDGSDNYGEAAKQIARAAKEARNESAKQAAAAATVQASVEGGKAAAELAAGTAAAGPWGAILSAAWSLRHTLFKTLVCICLLFLVIIVLIVSLPSVVTNSIFGLNGSAASAENPTTLLGSYNDLAADVSAVIEEGYNAALSKVEQIIRDGEYDYDLSMDVLVNYAQSSAGYDVSYILAAYSASLQQRGTSKENMLEKLQSVADSMFPVTSIEREVERSSTDESSPETETVKYVECTIHPFDNSVIIHAFGIDASATYDQFQVTYGEAIQKMANALKMTLYGTLGNGQMVPLTDAELLAFVNAQNCSPMRKHILTTALSLVGKVPYFWGGKSAPGWNDAWNTPRLVTAAGSSTTGTIRPYGLDCSGFTTWVFNTAVDVEIGAGCNGQYPNTYAVSASELLPGDLGFLADEGGWGHVLIFAGYSQDGTRMWVHSSGGIGVILNTPSYEGDLSYRRLSIVDYDAPVASVSSEENTSMSGE